MLINRYDFTTQPQHPSRNTAWSRASPIFNETAEVPTLSEAGWGWCAERIDDYAAREM
jgi:hypothetical protein